jgi:hypothetical protein
VQDDCVAVTLELPEFLILGQVEPKDHFEVTVRYWRDKVPYPICLLPFSHITVSLIF